MSVAHFYDKDQLHALMHVGGVLEFDGPRSGEQFEIFLRYLQETARLPSDVLDPKMEEWRRALPAEPDEGDWKRVTALMIDFVTALLREAGHI